MAKVFHFGPYASVKGWGLLPGKVEHWAFGPYDWDNAVVMVTAHPMGSGSIGDRRLAVTGIEIRKVRTGAGLSQYVHCDVRNVGDVQTNFNVWIGAIRPDHP
jgi:hypothetical protein